VKRIVDRNECGVAAPPRKDRGHNYDDVSGGRAPSKIDSGQGRISVKRLLPAARTAGYESSARKFRRLVATQKAVAQGQSPRTPTRWSSTGACWTERTYSARCGLVAGGVRAFADSDSADTTLVMLAESYEPR